MALPKPKNKEKRTDFVSRCMSELTTNEEFKDPKQRVAVCYSQYKEAKASADGVVDLENDDEMLLLSQKDA
jgi:hypothetical protein